MQHTAVRIDKFGLEHYARNYDEYLGPVRAKALRVLELGIYKGDSIRHWADYLPQARIVGLDTNPKIPGLDNEQIVTYQGEQQDRALLDKIAAEHGPFDIIIDDAAHVGQFARISFWHLFEHHLKPGGLYFIEDWGTGYWPSYPDGKHYTSTPVDFMWHERVLNWLASRYTSKLISWPRWNLVKRRHKSHDYGMVGFIKELIDECGAGDATAAGLGVGLYRRSRFDWVRVSPGHVVVRKR